MLKKIITTVACAAMVLAIGVPVIPDADAKGFSSSRSFSSSSFSRSSYRSSGSSSKSMFSSYKSTGKSTKAPSIKPKTSTKKTTSSKFGNSKGKTASYKTVASGKQTKTAKVALNKQRSKFKKPAKTTSTNSAAYKRNYGGSGVYKSAAKSNPKTYYTRRNTYYAGYSTPTYVYGVSPSYGMWDTIFLYSMLSSMNNNSHASQFSHNYGNNADYQNWRREADALSRDNAELRAQLATLDGQTSKLNGQPINTDYLPEGVDADLVMSQGALSSLKPTFRVCTGEKSGAYFRVTAGLLAPGTNSVNMVAVTTHGTGEILQNIADGKCDAGFVQGDGYWNYVETHQTDKLPFVRLFSPFKEEVHLVCNENGPKTIANLTAANKVWFPKNSGAEQTWKNFIGEDEKYGKIQTVLNTPSMAINTYEDGMLKVSNDIKSCAMFVAAEGATTMMQNIDKGAKATNSVLIDIEDGSLNDTTDPSGKDVYAFSELSTYKGLLRKGGCYGYCSGNVKTLSLNADFIIAEQWKAKNTDQYATLALELIGMSSEIKTSIKQ